jgi:hypothetical protein
MRGLNVPRLFSAPTAPAAKRPAAAKFTVLMVATLLGSCASERANGPRISEADAHTLIEQALPATVSDKPGWADDIYAAFTAQQIEPTKENVCAVVAVITQESNFQVNPAVPGMSQIAW